MIRRLTLSDLEDGSLDWRGAVAALGTFDGVHRGHQSILALAQSLAKARGVKSVAFTFDRLPVEHLMPDRAPHVLTPLAWKCHLLKCAGIDEVAVVRFDAELASVSAERFATRILGGLGLGAVVVGYNFSFGAGGLGNVALLTRLGQQAGYEVHVMRPVLADEQVVSSTAIRGHLASGHVQAATTLLGRPAALWGQVVEGEKRGRTLGFPTANLRLPERMLVPADGVYAGLVYRVTLQAADDSVVIWQREELLGQGLTVVSNKPTFTGRERTVETHILDFHGDLYGDWLRADLATRLRGITRFSGPEALRRQIDEDVVVARSLLQTNTEQAHCGILAQDQSL